MKFAVVLVFSLLLASLVDEINSDPSSTWWAKEYPPQIMTLEKMRNLLIRPWKIHEMRVEVRVNQVGEAFDARDKWGNLILEVRDQGNCGSCWAFAVAETTGDRIGIAGLTSVVYSPQDLVSCDENDFGVCVFLHMV
jgi:cathepsin B